MLLHPKFSKNGKWFFYSAPGPAGKNVIRFFDREAAGADQGSERTDYSVLSKYICSPGKAHFQVIE
jgi:hypothetical protein